MKKGINAEGKVRGKGHESSQIAPLIRAEKFGNWAVRASLKRARAPVTRVHGKSAADENWRPSRAAIVAAC